MHRKILCALVLLFFNGYASADEGMWLLNQPPRKLLTEKYNFDLTDAWLDRAMKASIRFNNGGTAPAPWITLCAGESTRRKFWRFNSATARAPWITAASNSETWKAVLASIRPRRERRGSPLAPHSRPQLLRKLQFGHGASAVDHLKA